MKTGVISFIISLMIFSFVNSGCTPKARYERKLKQELAKGVRYDSLFMGLYLGMPQKDFYTHCWELNRMGIIRQGSNNTTVEYQITNELKYPASMNFYPNFVDNRIAEMPVKFAYSGWAPWNQKLSSDSLQIDVVKWFVKMYGNHFMKVNHPKRGTAFIKLDGNRRITIFRENEMNVWAIFSDMSVMKETSDTSGIANIPADTAKVIK